MGLIDSTGVRQLCAANTETIIMPRIQDRITHCAFYLYADLDSAKKGQQAGGTGFVVARIHSSPILGGAGRLFLVSNKHVVHQHGCSVARINRKDGGVDFIDLEPHEWIAHPNHDIAAIGTNQIDPDVHECTWVHYNQLMDREFYTGRDVGVGDDVFMVGRFIGHDGGVRNRPSVRFGNISLAPADILNSETGIREESFGVEMRSKPGYSGSPVFVYDFLSVRASLATPRIDGFQVLLGVEWGHINERVPVLNKWGKQEDSRYVVSPSGMNGVVPAWRLKELFDMPELKKPFDDAEISMINISGSIRAVIQPMVASASVGAFPPADDANQAHRKESMGLVGAAARKPLEED